MASLQHKTRTMQTAVKFLALVALAGFSALMLYTLPPLHACITLAMVWGMGLAFLFEG